MRFLPFKHQPKRSTALTDPQTSPQVRDEAGTSRKRGEATKSKPLEKLRQERSLAALNYWQAQAREEARRHGAHDQAFSNDEGSSNHTREASQRRNRHSRAWELRLLSDPQSSMREGSFGDVEDSQVVQAHSGSPSYNHGRRWPSNHLAQQNQITSLPDQPLLAHRPANSAVLPFFQDMLLLGGEDEAEDEEGMLNGIY